MTLLAPWFLIGLLAAAIPLLLHLRRARQTRAITFSTTQFFDERFLRAHRRARLQEHALMALRMALFALLAIALAQPLLRTTNLPLLGDGPRQVALVIDNGATMSRADADGALLERAKAGAHELVAELSPTRGDRATIVLAGAREQGPRLLFDQPIDDPAALRQAIARIEPTDLASDLDAAVEAAARAIDAETGAGPATAGRQEIYVFSDFTESALRPVDALPAAETAGLFIVPTRPAQATDRLAVDVVQYGAARPMAGVPFHFRARITNPAPARRAATAELVIDDGVVSERTVDVPAGRSRMVRFSHRFTEPGWFAGRVEIAEAEPAHARPALAATRARHFTVHVQDRVRVLAVNGAPSTVRRHDELFFFKLALTARPRNDAAFTPPIEVDEIEPDALPDVSLNDYPLVVLANLAAMEHPAVESLERYVDRGGSLFVSLGDRVEPRTYNAIVGEHRLHGGLLPARLGPTLGSESEHSSHRNADTAPAAAATTTVEEPRTNLIATADTDHPMLAGFEAGGLGRLANVRFDQRYRLEPVDGAAPRVLLRDAAGEPLLLERAFGRGRVMLFASGLNRAWTNFPLQPTYVPWLYRMVSYLSQQTTPRANFVRTGEIVTLPGAATAAAAYRIDGPDGWGGYAEPDPRRPDAAGARALTDTSRAGAYAVRDLGAPRDAPPLMMFAANVPAAVAQPTYLDETTLRASVGEHPAFTVLEGPEGIAAAADIARHGYGLWNTLLWLALGLALFEPWLANRLAQRRAARAPDPGHWRDLAPAEPDTHPRHAPRPAAPQPSRETEPVA